MKSLRNRLVATSQAGFTLIELVIVIVIIGILAAVAIPQFADVTGDAKQAAVDGIGANYASAFGANKAMCAGYPTDTTKCKAAATTCGTTGLDLLLPGTGATAAIEGTKCVVSKGSPALKSAGFNVTT